MRSSAIFSGLATITMLMVGLSGCGGGGGSASAPLPAPVDSGPDPLYGNQWYLRNNGQFTKLLVGEDINVEPVWNGGTKGSGVLLVVVDDGLEIGHEDLADLLAGGGSRGGGHGSY